MLKLVRLVSENLRTVALVIQERFPQNNRTHFLFASYGSFAIVLSILFLAVSPVIDFAHVRIVRQLTMESVFENEFFANRSTFLVCVSHALKQDEEKFLDAARARP